MASSTPQARRRLYSATSRELLGGVLGWQPTQRAQSRLTLEGVAYRLTRLAARGSTVALLCEAPLGAHLPDYPARRRIRRRIEALHPRHLTIFTDAACSVQIWTWTTRPPGGPRMYREQCCDPERPVEPLLRRLEELPGEEEAEARPGGPAEPGSPGALIPPLLLRAVRGSLPSGTGVEEQVARLLQRDPERYGAADEAGGPPLPETLAGLDPRVDLRQLVQDLVEVAEDAGLLRAVWRAVRDFTVLDPACGSGGWLLAALETLESVYDACLERMQVWVGELERARRSHRPELRRDFRAVLARADDTRRHPSRRAFIREQILLHNLHGADREPEAVEACRLRLLRRLRGPHRAGGGPALPGSACSLGVGDPSQGLYAQAEIERALVGTPGAAEALREIAEEAESFGRADGLLRRMYSTHAADAEGLERGMSALRVRREALNARLDRLAARRAGVDPDDADALQEWLREHHPFHLFSECHAVVRRGGFDLVRAGSG